MDYNPSVTLENAPNIGPTTARRLADVGIDSLDDVRRVGAVAAYVRLKRAYPRETSLNALWALWGAIEDVPWQRVPPRVRVELQAAAAAELRE
jgi:DNA transformation protein